MRELQEKLRFANETISQMNDSQPVIEQDNSFEIASDFNLDTTQQQTLVQELEMQKCELLDEIERVKARAVDLLK